MMDDTNLAIARLIAKQTYEERIDFARWLKDAAEDRGCEADTSEFAAWVGSWADATIHDDEEMEVPE